MSSLAQPLRELDTQMQGTVSGEEKLRILYSTDASVYQEMPVAVAFPKSASDIQHLVQFAKRHRVGLIPRTAGTSLAGQVVGNGIVVDVSRHMNQILNIDEKQRTVTVQPGVIRNELNRVLKPHQMMFAPETSTANRAMIGGMVGNNSCGANSIVYGSTRDHVHSITGVLSDGSLATFGPLDRDATPTKQGSSGQCSSLEQQIYQGIWSILSPEDVQQRIREQFPKPSIQRRNTGYAIDRLIESDWFGQRTDVQARRLNLCDLISGSEGTLMLMTEIELRCVALPPAKSNLLCVHFETIDQAMRATRIAVRHQPFRCELIDGLVLEGAARNIEQQKNAQFVCGSPEAILLIEFRDDLESALVDRAEELQRELKQESLGYAFPVLSGNQADAAWELRRAGLGVVANVPGDTKPTTVIEDTAVDVEDLPEYIAELGQMLKTKYSARCVHYAHAGAGELHLRPLINLKTAEGAAKFRAIATDVANLVKKYRGSLSGEHGDGRLRAEFLELMVGPENYVLMKQIKQLFDPNNIFNPGKIIAAPPMDAKLRSSTHHKNPPSDYETIFDFSHSQGLLRATEMCSGSGDCLKTHLAGGTMCPSYMATRDETASTRGRANMLRHILTQPKNARHPFDHDQAKEVLDLCLSCKACKGECPSNVDLARLKAEFLQGYYDARGVPRRARVIADFSKMSRLAAPVPWLYNWLANTSLAKRMIGFHQKRSAPRLSGRSLRSWFRKHLPDANAGRLGSIVLFCDEFTNAIDVRIGIAAIELLEALGWRIELPRHQESGRASISQGLLRQARKFANKNVSILCDLVHAERPLVGIEPSALLTLRDEYPDLVDPHLREKAQRMASHTLLIDEFLARAIDAGQIDSSRFHTRQQQIALHGHCHQKALSSVTHTVKALSLPENYQVQLIPSGCCGMAGSFGFEREHFELSQQIGELVLFPAIRKLGGQTLIAATGTSCRHQILDGTRRSAEHPVEILRNALVV